MGVRRAVDPDVEPERVRYERPAVTSGKGVLGDETEETHPAYGQIGADRVDGRTFLYGSDFEHRGYVQITIRRSRRNRSLSRDWHFAAEELISVALSEAQWATFVSAMNRGMGVPCTLDHISGERVPQIPAPERSRTDQFGEELRKTFDQALKRIEELKLAIQGSPLSGRRKEELLRLADRAARAVTGDAEFGADQFGEYMETTVERAKMEIGAFATAMIHRAGLAALGVKTPIRFLGEGSAVPDEGPE